MKNCFKTLGIMFIMSLILVCGWSVSAFAADIVYTDNRIPLMTSYVTPYGFVNSNNADLLYSSGYSAFDENPNTSWKGDTVDSGWLQYAFIKPVKIEKYTITNDSRFGYMYPRSLSLKASNTGEFKGEEVTLDTRYRLVFESGEKQTFICQDIPTKGYTNYRIVITNSGGFTPSIADIEMMERAISLDNSSINLNVNNSKKLTATVNGLGYPGAVTWKSSNTSIATVDSDGNVKGIKEGQATITAYTNKAEGIVASATCRVTVTDNIFLEMPDGNKYSVKNSQVKDFIQWYNNRDTNTSDTPTYKFN